MPRSTTPDRTSQEAVEPDAGFAGLGLDPGLLTTLAELGYEEPTAIQREAVPPLLDRRDVLACSPSSASSD